MLIGDQHRSERICLDKYSIKYDEDDFNVIKADLTNNPMRWPVMPGAGGFRKMRYAPIGTGRGKSGGVRVIYFYRDSDKRVSFATMIRKSDRASLTKAERNELAKLANQLKRST